MRENRTYGSVRGGQSNLIPSTRLTALRAEGCGLPLRAMLIKSALRDLLSVPYGMISILVISHLRWLFPPPLVPYGTTFPPRWEACHTILRSLCSLTNRVPLPPRYRSGDKRKAPLWAGQAPCFARLAHPMQDVHSGQ